MEGTPAGHVTKKLFVEQINVWMCPDSFSVFIYAQCKTINMNRCRLCRKPPSCTAAGTASNGIYPNYEYSATETTTGYPRTGYCPSLVLTINALEYFLSEQHALHFAFEQMMMSCGSSKAGRQVQGQGEMDFTMDLLQAQEHQVSLYD